MRVGSDPAPEVLVEGPEVTETGAVFRINAVPGWQPTSVWFHLRDFGADTRFRRQGGQWVAKIPRPPVDRMEYLISGSDGHGNASMGPDPTNPHRARSVFGDHSILEFPGYERPDWLGTPAPAGSHEPIQVIDGDAHVVVTGDLWCPADSIAADPLPLLVVHDGPEYADLADLMSYIAYANGAAPNTRCRVLLLKPIDRDRSYSASPGYARALVQQALPMVTDRFETRGPLVGAGASLGGLAMLHAAVTYPGTFGGLFLQSGSFFVPRFDGHEKRFKFYERVVRFVKDATAEPERLAGMRIRLTCGTGEENLYNNELFFRRLRKIGVDCDLSENRDGHNYGAWRDCLDPGLGDLMVHLWA